MGIFREVIEILKQLPRRDKQRHLFLFVHVKGRLGLAGKFNPVRDKQRHLFLLVHVRGRLGLARKFNSVSHSGTMWLVLILEDWPISVSGQLPTYPSPNPTTVY